MATLKPFGEKAYRFAYRHPSKDKPITILEGSIRSGKTFTYHPKIITQLNKYDVGGLKVIIGVSKGTIKDNLLRDLFSILGESNYRYNQSTGELWIGKTLWLIIGAKDDGSEKYLRGKTIGIALVEEGTLIPESFMMQLLGRLSPDGSRLYINTNPDSPYHYLKANIIDDPDKAQDIEVIHFDMDDNPNLSLARRESNKRMFKGVFYQRFILGLWVIAEGVIYRDSLSEATYYDDESRPVGLLGQGGYVERFIPIDYGTANQTVFLDVIDDGETYWVDDEWVWDSRKENLQKTDKQYADDLEAWIADKRGAQVIVDPSAASFKVELAQRGIWHCDAVNDVLDGIRTVSSLLAQRKVRIHKRCKNLNQQMQTYAWCEKSAKLGEEKPIKKEDHGPDTLRYFAQTKVPKWRIAG